MTKKTLLIEQINKAFKDVKLEGGVGLWQAQGLDDSVSIEACEKLRERDEKNDWHKIPVIHLYQCSSSLSFLDAKGMRFHLPQFLLFDLDVFESKEDELYKNGALKSTSCPEVLFPLIYKLESDHSIRKFSALNNTQVQCVIDYLHWQIAEGMEADEIKSAIEIWKRKLK